MNICLFCRTEGPLRTREHIIPESLGNDTDILENAICEKCQNYFGREIEKPALEKTNLAFWRTYLGIRTKRNRLPSVNLDPPIRGAIRSVHPMTEFGIGFSACQDGFTSIDVRNQWQKERLLYDKSEYLLVMTPWHLSILGRFLGKIGLEFVALSDIKHALSPAFDQIRTFVRFGSTKRLWPIYCGQQGKLMELKGPIIWDGFEGRQEIECYCYSLGRKLTGEILFAFRIGTDLMLICLSNDLPVPGIEDCVVDVKLSCLHYPDGPW